MKATGLEVLEEKMKGMDPSMNDRYKFLGCEQGDGIDVAMVINRIMGTMKERMEKILSLNLYDKNMIDAINTRVMPVAMYPMNVMRISTTKLIQLEGLIKRELRSKHLHGRLASDERLYLPRKFGGRGLKCLRDAYEETKIRIACYLCRTERPTHKMVWKRECEKEFISLQKEANEALERVGCNVKFEKEKVMVDGEEVTIGWQKAWRRIKEMYKKGKIEARMNTLRQKEQQSNIWKEQHMICHVWLDAYLTPVKTGAIIEMMEQMVETREWKRIRRIPVDSNKCRVCNEYKENVQHILGGCKVLAGKEYLIRHNQTLMVFVVQWAKMKGLLAEDVKWYKENWETGKVLENKNYKMLWDFQFKLLKTEKARRPDLILEDYEEKKIYIVDMAVPMEVNVRKGVPS